MSEQLIIDHGMRKYEEELLNTNHSVVIGILAEDAETLDEDGEITLYQKALNVEFGIEQPKRPYMRTSYEINEQELIEHAILIDEEVIEGTFTYTQGLDEIGEAHKGQIQEVMANGRDHFKLNSKSWARVKGGTPETVTPTIHTGQLRGSISHKVIIDE